MSASGALSGLSGPAGMLPSAVSLTGGGGLEIAGLEWLGARAYDPMARGFLSTDPLAPVLGAGCWVGREPVLLRREQPLNATDPTGLRPLTDEELKAYDGSSRGAFAAVGDWSGDNWEYLAGGAMAVAGGVLMATGVGGPVGLALIGAGADTIIQKATTGSVNWGQVAISGAVGLVAGPIAGRAGKAIVSGLGRATVTQMGKVAVTNGGIGGAVNTGMYYMTTPQKDWSLQGAGGALPVASSPV